MIPDKLIIEINRHSEIMNKHQAELDRTVVEEKVKSLDIDLERSFNRAGSAMIAFVRHEMTEEQMNAALSKENEKALSRIRTALTEVAEAARAAEQNRIYEEGWKIIHWYKNPKNQWAGLVPANNTINAIHMLLDKVKEPMSAQSPPEAPAPNDTTL